MTVKFDPWTWHYCQLDSWISIAPKDSAELNAISGDAIVSLFDDGARLLKMLFTDECYDSPTCDIDTVKLLSLIDDCTLIGLRELAIDAVDRSDAFFEPEEGTKASFIEFNCDYKSDKSAIAWEQEAKQTVEELTEEDNEYLRNAGESDEEWLRRLAAVKGAVKQPLADALSALADIYNFQSEKASGIRNEARKHVKSLDKAAAKKAQEASAKTEAKSKKKTDKSKAKTGSKKTEKASAEKKTEEPPAKTEKADSEKPKKQPKPKLNKRLRAVLAVVTLNDWHEENYEAFVCLAKSFEVDTANKDSNDIADSMINKLKAIGGVTELALAAVMADVFENSLSQSLTALACEKLSIKPDIAGVIDWLPQGEIEHLQKYQPTDANQYERSMAEPEVLRELVKLTGEWIALDKQLEDAMKIVNPIRKKMKDNQKQQAKLRNAQSQFFPLYPDV